MSEDLKIHKTEVLIGIPEALAKQRLMDFAASLSGGHDYDNECDYPEVTYTELMERAADYLATGEYWSEGSRFESQDVYKNFWEDYELVTKTKVDPNNKYSFFSCSC